MIWKLIAMIVLGILSAILSYYNKNYYVRIFNDILGREEDEDLATRVGRGFYYGFFFPVYFLLVVTALIALIAFLIAGGVLAAIVFVIVWVTEKLLPQKPLGAGIVTGLGKLGLCPPATETAAPVQAEVPPVEPPAPPAVEQPSEGTPPEQPSDATPPKQPGDDTRKE